MSDELNLDPSLAYDNNTTMANATPQQQNILPHPGQYPPDRITVVVDRQHFIHTRNAVCINIINSRQLRRDATMNIAPY